MSVTQASIWVGGMPSAKNIDHMIKAFENEDWLEFSAKIQYITRYVSLLATQRTLNKDFTDAFESNSRDNLIIVLEKYGIAPSKSPWIKNLGKSPSLIPGQVVEFQLGTGERGKSRWEDLSWNIASSANLYNIAYWRI
jgi:hypothetical protein